VGAGPLSVTVPVEVLPPTTEVGFSERADRVAALIVSVAPWLPPSVPVINDEVLLATALVVTTKVVDVFPAGTVTEVGTCAAAVLLLCRVTTDPPVGAALFSVTVPIELFPPTTNVGFTERADRVTAVTVSVALWLCPSVPVINDDVLLATALVVTTNVADVLPAGTVTDGGTCAAAVLLLCRVTIAPPVGAAPLSVTVPVDVFPPATEVGFTDRVDRLAALTVSVVAWATPYVPKMLTVVFAPTGLVATLNVVVVAPAATVTLPGTCAAVVLSLASVTTAPPAGALPVSVTVPAELVPPRTLVGFRVTEASVGGVTIRAADWVAPKIPEIVATVEDETAPVVTLKSAVVAPRATVTLAGTCAALLLLANVTTAPPAGATPFSVTVPAALVPPTTEVGFNDTVDRVGALTVSTAVSWSAP